MTDWRTEIRRRLSPLGLAPEREAEIVDEIAQHLEDRFSELCAMGRSDAESAAGAWMELEEGDVLGREVGRTETLRPLDLPPPGKDSRAGFLATLAADLKYATRTLVKQPSFSLPVLLALALAIGPTTAVVSLGNSLLWRPLDGVSNASELGVVRFGTWREGGMSPTSVSYQNADDVIASARSVVGMVGVQEQQISLTAGDRPPERVGGAYVNHDFFRVLGTRIVAGRDFHPDEDRQPHGALVAVVSDGFAHSAFGSPEAAIGRRLQVNRATVEVIGVAAPGFRGITKLRPVQVWIPGASIGAINGVSSERAASRGGGIFSTFVVRIAEGATWQAVDAELKVLTLALANAYPDENKRFGTIGTVTPRVFEGIGEDYRTRESTETTVRLLLAVAAVLVVLGCANAANLLVFRAGKRQREVAIRKALGASAARLVQLQLTESWLLAIVGALLGLGIAVVLTPVLKDLMFPEAGTTVSVPIDWRVLILTFFVATTTGIMAGLAPAWMAARNRLSGALTGAGSRSVARVPRLRSTLAVVQLSLSLALLIGALLLVSTVRHLRAVDMGFDPYGLTTMSVDLLPQGHTQASALAYWRVLSEAFSGSPLGDLAVAHTSPFYGGFGIDLLRDHANPKDRTSVSANGITSEYFSTLNAPVLRGRTFTVDEAWSAPSHAPTPVIVNETLARQWFGDTNVVGRTVRLAATAGSPQRDVPIVGVVQDLRWNSVTGSPEPFLFMPFSQFPFRATSALLFVRTSLPTEQITTAVRLASQRIDGRIPIPAGQPLIGRIDQSIRQQRLFAWTLSILGALGFVLAALGVYGLMSQSTAERSREFGIRIAIGASRADIASLIVRFGAKIAVLGTVSGVALAAYGSRALASLLYGVTPLDVTSYLVAVSTLLIVMGIACALPALRAMRVEPVEILRSE